MKVINFIALLFFLFSPTQGFMQKPKNPVYNVKVLLKNGKKQSGILYTIDSTFMQLISSKTFDTTNLKKLSASEIKKFKLKRKGGNLGPIALGAGIGAVIGVMAAVFENGDEEEESVDIVKDAMGAKLLFITVPVGAGVGAFVAAKSLSYPIDGDPNKFTAHLEELNKYAIKKD